MPDFTRSLSVLKDEWSTCTKCDLGVHRDDVRGEFVFGEGYSNGIMFIGEGPGKDEEASGRPFIGRSGDILRRAIAKLNLQNCYISNLVCCRSCEQAHNSAGEPVFVTDRKLGGKRPFIVDRPPTGNQIEACSPRLYEEIYLVDPILIVTLGSEASKALSQSNRFGAMRDERGKTRPVSIPGAWNLPVLTEKKKAWQRKVHGQVVMPTEQNMVQYLMYPTYHPAFVARNSNDLRHGNVVDAFLEDMKSIARIYDRYLLETQGVIPYERDVSAEDIFEGATEG